MTDRANLAGSQRTTLDDPRRLATLARTGLFPEESIPATDSSLDRLSALTARLLGTPAACVTFISAHESLVAGSTGTGKGADRRALADGCCERVVLSGNPLVIDDIASDASLRTNPIVGDYGIASYCGVPLTIAGETLGALCAFDTKVHSWTSADLAILTDLAELVKHEIEMRIMQREEAIVPRRFEPLLNAIPAGIYACDADGRLVFYNERAAGLWGTHPPLGSREPDAFASRGLTRHDGTPVPEAETPVRLALRGATPPRPVELTLGAASEAAVALASAEPLVLQDGELAGAFGVLQDVTALRQASRLRDELLALVSHELRTPLTVISGMASYLDHHREHEDGASTQAIETLVLASRRMERVVENMLQLSHLDHDRAEPEPLLAEMLVDSALASFARDFPDARVGRLDGAGRVVVLAVESWSAFALANLLQNAQLYGHGSDSTQIQLVRHENELHIRVCNPGDALTAAEYEALFEPFFRRPHTRNTIPGAGLGLTTARKLAEAQGGRLLAGPRPDGRGSMFTLALPVYQAA